MDFTFVNQKKTKSHIFRGRPEEAIPRLIKNVILIILALCTLYPFIWMISASFKTDGVILANPASLAIPEFSFASYVKIWDRVPFLLFYKNSIIFAGFVTISVLFFDSMAAYAFARLNFKGRNILFILILSTMMIPFQVLMIPLFVEMKKLNLLDTFPGLIIPRAADAFGIFMLRGFFITLPKDLEEAARIDGCNEFTIYRKVMLPLCKTAFLSLGLFVFNANWGDLLYPLLMTSKDSMRTLQAGIAMLMGTQYGPTEYSLMMAGSFLAVAPIVLIYFFLQKYFIQGIAMTGMKG
nr:carbohydrate ABC transporter permease [uncultured Sphaerochaeta sp.]